MTYFVSGNVMAAEHAKADAASATARAETLATATDALNAYAREAMASSLIVGAQGAQLTPAMLSVVLGMDLNASLADARAHLDATLAALPADFPLHTWAAALTALRPAIDAGTITQDDFFAATVTADAELRIFLKDQFVELVKDTRASPDAARLREAADSVSLMVSVLDVVAHQNAAVLLLQNGIRSSAGQDHLAALVANNAEFEHMSEEIARRVPEPLQTRWTDFLTSDANLTVNDALQQTEQRALADDLPQASAGELSGLLRQTTVRLDATFLLMEQSNEELLSAAQDLRATARAASQRSLAAAAAIASAALAAIAAISRTIVRPLRKLEGASGEIHRGDLPDGPLRVSGPREVAVATDAFNGLIATLDVVSRQADSLARGELDSDALELTAPGRLGASMHASVERLQDSISAQRLLHDQLAFDATHDRLTGLASRAAATDAIEQLLQTGRTLTIALIALDGFKAVNDALGHAVGDLALSALAGRLRRQLPPDTLVARWGGDEFVVVSTGHTATEAAALGQELLAAIQAPLDIGTSTLRLGASVGLVPPTAGVTTVAEALRAANVTTRQAKSAGRGMLRLFDATGRADLDRIDTLAVRLRTALANDELTLHYQPLIDTRSGKLVEVEALIRWFPADGPPISPGEFLPVAEATGLSAELDEWVVQRAAGQLAEWKHNQALRNVTVAVNLTAASALSHGMGERVLSWLWWANADPGRLIVEINEDTFVSSFASMGERLEVLRSAGVKVAIDDFGTGLTSIGQLRAMPVDVVKLDRSLVAGTSATDRRVLRAVVELGHALDLGIVAEGIETAEQADLCTELGCHRLQGWLYAPALAPEDLATWAANREATNQRRSLAS